MDTNTGLDFEAPIFEAQLRLEAAQNKSPIDQDEVRELKQQLTEVMRATYESLSPWDVVKVARHKDRPHTSDYISMVFDEFVELHGDKFFGDDKALRVGFAKLGEHRVLLVGHQKGRTTKDRTNCYFGMAHPEGYRKALQKMKLAAKFGVPVICLIDTPGAYPGLGAEERGQAQAIAENMFEMSRLETPIICVVIGEGGSGGALGIGVGDRVGMLRNAYYSVISPEGCAGILWKSHKYAEQAAKALRFTSKDLLKFGVIDEIVDEPLGGAHRDPHQMAQRLKMFLVKHVGELKKLDDETLLQQRYEKFRAMGEFLESTPADGVDSNESDSVSSLPAPHLKGGASVQRTLSEG